METEKSNIKLFDKRTLSLLNNKNLILLALMGGFEAGFTSGWASLTPQILNKAGYDSNFIGWTGFFASLSIPVGG